MLFRSTESINLKRGFLAFLAKQPRWKGLPYLFRALRSESKEISSLAQQHLRRVVCRSMVQFPLPDENLRKAIRAEIDLSKDLLDPHLIGLIEFSLRI